MSDQPTTPEEKPEAPRKRASKAPKPVDQPAPEEKPAVVAQSASAPQEISVKIRVLENGLKVAGGVAAKGRVLNLRQSQAVALQELGKVKIIGI